MNRKIVTKMSNFILGNGFYIALTLCIGLIVLSGYYLWDSAQIISEPLAPVSGSVELVIPEPSFPVALPENVKPLESPEPEVVAPTVAPVEEEIPAELLEESVVEEPGEESLLPLEIQYSWPVWGEVTQTHSMDVLVFHPTMGDWRTHTGIDISTDIHSEVMAVADGQVTALIEDDMMGTTVVIAHGNEMESTYSNLGEFPSVVVGEWVKGGQIIAVVGNTALSEQGSDPHLQFSMTESGQDVDPLLYLPEQNQD